MRARTAPIAPRSDDDLLRMARAGREEAFDELWERHVRSATRVARQFGSGADPEAVVREVRATGRSRILSGGGPSGAARPYLYSAVREVAECGRAAPTAATPGDDEALDRALTVRAYRSLPVRWQNVLWYVEVERMTPVEIAPLMGMSVPATAALAERARAGLRSAWLGQHAAEASGSADCRWAIVRLDGARTDLSERERTRLDAHLDSCGRCTALADRAAAGGPRLAVAVVPAVVGVVAGGALLGQLSIAEAAHAVTVAGATGLAASGATAAATAGSGVPALVSGLAAAAIVGRTVALGPSAAVPSTPPISAVAAPVAAARPVVSDATTTATTTPIVAGTASGGAPHSASTVDLGALLRSSTQAIADASRTQDASARSGPDAATTVEADARNATQDGRALLAQTRQALLEQARQAFAQQAAAAASEGGQKQVDAALSAGPTLESVTPAIPTFGNSAAKSAKASESSSSKSSNSSGSSSSSKNSRSGDSGSGGRGSSGNGSGDS